MERLCKLHYSQSRVMPGPQQYAFHKTQLLPEIPGSVSLCKTSFYEYILPKWTNTSALTCTAHDEDIVLSLYCPNYNGSSNEEGHSIYLPFNWAKNSYQNKHQKHECKSLSLILSKIILKLY
jgi:hypothetical protein